MMASGGSGRVENFRSLNIAIDLDEEKRQSHVKLHGRTFVHLTGLDFC
jgi:hypothetical protein